MIMMMRMIWIEYEDGCCPKVLAAADSGQLEEALRDARVQPEGNRLKQGR